MKKLLVPCIVAVLASAWTHAAPVDDLKAAAKKLGDAPNYAWTSTTEMAGGGFGAGTATGVTEKDGCTVITRDFGGNTFQSARKGDKVAMQDREGQWKTREEIMQQFGGGAGGGGNRGGGRFGIETPADQLSLIAAQVKDAKLAEGAIVGDLSEQGATELVGMGRGAKNASGSVKAWLKDGTVSKFQIHLKGTVAGRDGQDRDIDRTTTVEIKDVGSTKVQVPDGAKQKLGS